jgi:phosphoribosylamine--glycine ligase
MKVLIIGGGGREHAIAWKLSQSRHVNQIYSSPGNPGIAEIAECIDVNPGDFRTLIDVVKYEWIDLTIVCAEQALADGIVNAFEREGCKILGPNRTAARLQSSRVFAKGFLRRHRIPTANYRVFSSYLEAQDYVRMKGFPMVIKTDGYCGDRGIFVATSEDEAMGALKLIMKDRTLGDSGRQVIIEEGLKGDRVSVSALTDGKTILPLTSLFIYRNMWENAAGVITGVIGAYSPVPLITDEIETCITAKIFKPLQKAFDAEGMKVRGVISADLIVDKCNVHVFDISCCFGSFDAQTLLPRLKNDLGDVLLGVVGEKLSDVVLEWDYKASVCIPVFLKGPTKKSGVELPIKGLAEIKKMEDVILFHEKTFFQGAEDITTGENLLDVTAMGDSVRAAREKAYEAVGKISFEGMYYQDINIYKERI